MYFVGLFFHDTYTHTHTHKMVIIWNRLTFGRIQTISEHKNEFPEPNEFPTTLCIECVPSRKIQRRCGLNVRERSESGLHVVVDHVGDSIVETDEEEEEEEKEEFHCSQSQERCFQCLDAKLMHKSI